MDGLIADVNYAHFSSYKLPAVYGESFVAALGGLISYGPENIDQFRCCRLRRSHPQGRETCHLPMQAPTKYQLVINLKTAKAIGVTIPQSLQASADEVIE